MRNLRIYAYDDEGVRVKDTLITEATEAPEFYAHQLLHATNVVCVEVFDTDTDADLDTPMYHRCDPGVDIDTLKGGDAT